MTGKDARRPRAAKGEVKEAVEMEAGGLRTGEVEQGRVAAEEVERVDQEK